MGKLNWAVAVGSSNTIRKGVGAGLPKPAGGGSFAHGFHSIDPTPGVVAYYCAQNGVAPTPPNKGGEISGTVQRGLSGGKTKFAPFIFAGLSGTAVTDRAYILGLGDADPSHIVLRKGTLSGGLPDVAPGTQGVLRRSTGVFADQVYWHLRLQMVCNPNGETIINCFMSDLTLHNVTSPVWVPIPGIAPFLDDPIGANSANLGIQPPDDLPMTSGRFGWGMRSDETSRRCYFDHFVIGAQN